MQKKTLVVVSCCVAAARVWTWGALGESGAGLEMGLSEEIWRLGCCERGV